MITLKIDNFEYDAVWCKKLFRNVLSIRLPFAAGDSVADIAARFESAHTIAVCEPLEESTVTMDVYTSWNRIESIAADRAKHSITITLSESWSATEK